MASSGDLHRGQAIFADVRLCRMMPEARALSAKITLNKDLQHKIAGRGQLGANAAALKSGRQALAAAGAAGSDHPAATNCFHSGAEAMPALAHQFTGLISPLHVSLRPKVRALDLESARKCRRPAWPGRARRKRGEGQNRVPYKGRLAKKSISGVEPNVPMVLV
jgi:hypothetical protein